MAAGEAVGRGVTPQWCSDIHIHVAMVKTGTVEEIDPTGYLRKRNMPPPKGGQNCNHYILHWKVGTVVVTIGLLFHLQVAMPVHSFYTGFVVIQISSSLTDELGFLNLEHD